MIFFQNAFMKALAIRNLTTEDFKKEGEKQWEEISNKFEPTNLIVADIDFTELYEKSSQEIKQDTMNQTSSCPPSTAAVVNNCNLKSTMPPPPPPPKLTPLLQPSKPKVPLAPFHWRPIQKPPLVESIWNKLPEVQFNNEVLVEMFMIKPLESRKAFI